MTILTGAHEGSVILNVLREQVSSMVIITLTVISVILSIVNLFIRLRKVNFAISVEVVILSILCIFLSVLIRKTIFTIFTSIVMILQMIYVDYTLVRGKKVGIIEKEEEEG